MVAANREYPLHNTERLSGLPQLPPDDLLAFESVVHSLGENQFMATQDELMGPNECGGWQTHDAYSGVRLIQPYKLWGLSPLELAKAAAHYIALANAVDN